MLYRIAIALALMIWVVVGFVAAQLMIGLVFIGLDELNISLEGANETTLNTIVAAVVYVLSLAIVIGTPWLIQKRITSREELGLKRLPNWMDILLAPAGVVVYLLLSGILAALAGTIEGFNADQAQDIGFTQPSQGLEYALAFFTLVVAAPVAEELLFRGYLFGKIRKRLPFVITLIMVSITFAALHIPGFNEAGEFQMQWNVALDVFALSLVLTSLREVTGNVWASILLHMIKNGLAFYLLFINPSLLATIGL